MKEKRYHPALKTLEQLENIHLPKISHCRFASKMKDQIPKLRTSIKEASMRELKDFLENIRKYSPKIGEIAMRHTAEKSNVDPTIVSCPDAHCIWSIASKNVRNIIYLLRPPNCIISSL